MKFSCRVIAVATAWAVVLSLFGCKETGPDRYSVSGNVTVDGKPAPAGYLVFTPDVTKDNRGLPGRAEVKAGKFTTATGQDASGGAQIVEVQTFDGVPFQGAEYLEERGKPLAPAAKGSFDLPHANATLDVDIQLGGAQPKLTLRLQSP